MKFSPIDMLTAPLRAVTQAQMKRLTAIHGWSAVLLGLLLYAVVATGTAAVFAREIGRWSAGGIRESAPLEGPVDARVRALAGEVDPAFLHDVGVWAGHDDDLHIFFHDHRLNPESGLKEDYGTIFRVDGGTGTVLERHDGFVWNDPAAYATSALQQFLVDLHVQLYLPEPWGLLVTGILGLMMMAAVVSGLIMHRHVIRDLFVAERPGGRLVSVRDRHVLASSWSLPFAFLLAFTGSFFSFASTIGFPLVASVAFGGDKEAMSETLFEPPVPEDATPARLASLDYLLADSTARAGAPATFVAIAGYGRADARVTVWHRPAPGGLVPVKQEFDGTSRSFLGAAPMVGRTPSAGSALYGLMFPLHFGDFAGIFSQAVWGGLGIAMCFVILSGLRLWVRRRAGQPLWDAFGRAMLVTGYGLPLGMLTAAWACCIARPAGDTFWWTPAGFLIGAGASILAGLLVAEPARLTRLFQRTLAAACLLLPLLRLATGGMTWSDALLHGQHDVLTVDLLLIAGGIAFWALTKPAGAARPALTAEPAE
ncbi:PepSY-associated TM helix domain-containing protein [Rhodobacteraceae bacterium DSL-40]|uniref:PepSY-associated TM helix domain-containing protein n=1 Tax=Amaricoccus sp. B4 TaxID=3368557 RepID=UPI000DAEF588